MVNSCILALWWSLSGTVCGTSYLERCLCFWLAPACQNTTYSCCYSAAHAFIFILYLLWTLCVPVAHLFCHALRGLDGILGWYSYTWAIILQKYILYFPWMSLRSSVSVGQRIKDDVLPLWLLSLGIIFMDKSLCDNIVKVKPHFIHIIWAFCLYWTAYRVIEGEGYLTKVSASAVFMIL